MSDVPSDFYFIILLHLPAESLLRCRAVCKSWCFMIDDPSFIKFHTLWQQSTSSSLLITDKVDCGRHYSLSFDTLTNARHGRQTVDMKALVSCGWRCDNFRNQAILCHGLVLLYHSTLLSKDDWVVWNPLTGDFVKLHNPETKYYLRGVGLGYDHAADDYKFVLINYKYEEREFVLRTSIYSLKSRIWKVIKDSPSESMICWYCGVYVNGALYWENYTVIVALDLATEEYRLLPLPPHTTDHIPGPNTLYDLDGCLFITCSYRIEAVDRLDVWMMKDEISGETPWIKLLSVVDDGRIRSLFCYYKLVAYSKSRGEVIMNRGSHIYFFDNQNNCKKVIITNLPDCFSYVKFRGSLVRLAGGDDGSSAVETTKRKRKKRVPRLKLSVTVDSSQVVSSCFCWKQSESA